VLHAVVLAIDVDIDIYIDIDTEIDMLNLGGTEICLVG
jgi:hypothetical protein